MENKTIQRFRWFWAWQDEAEEQWLSEMARQGWHLTHPSIGLYTFAAGAPGEYVYRLDYRNEMKSNLTDYFQLFQEAGWEHVGQIGGWQYWRKLAGAGESPEIFSDNASKIEKYQRLLAFLILPLSLLVITFVNLIDSPRLSPLIVAFFAATLLLMVFALARIWLYIHSLKKPG